MAGHVSNIGIVDVGNTSSTIYTGAPQNSVYTFVVRVYTDGPPCFVA